MFVKQKLRLVKLRPKASWVNRYVKLLVLLILNRNTQRPCVHFDIRHFSRSSETNQRHQNEDEEPSRWLRQWRRHSVASVLWIAFSACIVWAVIWCIDSIVIFIPCFAVCNVICSIIFDHCIMRVYAHHHNHHQPTANGLYKFHGYRLIGCFFSLSA